MKNRIKMVVGVIMMLQAVASFITFIVLACRKKKLWAAFLAIATAGSAGGAYLLFDGLSDEMSENKLIDDYDEESDEIEELRDEEGKEETGKTAEQE
ncbi:MAG: hypothetical protein J5940_01530 [Clostridia bacterium]|nr:hypothetical protein [Clostridia bacterium]